MVLGKIGYCQGEPNKMNKRKFLNKDTGKIITLTVNKTKMQIKYRGKWINGGDFYKKGYEDANIKQLCARCNKDIKPSFKWYCENCQIAHKKDMMEVINEVNNFLGDNL